jgi:ribosome biogenesis GTPase
MGKRKPPRRKHQPRANRPSPHSDKILTTSDLGPEQTGRIVAYYGANFAVQDPQGRFHYCLSRRNLPKLVCGDYVTWQPAGENEGVIVGLQERKSLLSRPDYQNQLKPVAANIDQILVVIAPEPALDEDLINRYLVAAALTDIEPVLVLNKTDLLRDAQLIQLKNDALDVYQTLGYKLIAASAKRETHLKDLKHCLAHKTSIFVGQSGVGKSSLIKAIIPDADIRIGELSQASGLGKHTTTVTMLYHLNRPTAIIDSPGIREFGLGHASQPRIAYGFVEFRPFSGHCKFNDCTHQHEPGCAVLEAVKSGQISRRRYESYRRIVDSLGKR